MSRQHCSNLADIAKEKSQANIEEKDKIVRNNDMVHACFIYISRSIHVVLSQYS